MSGQEDLIRVLDLIPMWLSTIKSHNVVGLFDKNKLAEGVALKLLNEIYGYSLENLNYEENNYPGIDLGDKINKIGFQISTRKDPRKFFESLDKFAKGPHNTYSNGIRFLILSQEKKPRLNKDKCKKIYPAFDPDKHILTANDLLKEIRQIYDNKKEKFSRIKGILEEEISGKAVEQGIGKIDLQQKVGEIFKLMGFEVKYNWRFGRNEVNVYIQKERTFGSKYEGYFCECKNRKGEVDKNEVLDYFSELKELLNYFKEKNIADVDLMIVSNYGFTSDAKKTAASYGVILKTYNEILSKLMDFDIYLTSLINDFEDSELKRLYVHPDFFLESERKVINGFLFVEEWLRKPDRGKFFLLGDHGTGKTSFAKALTYKMAKSYKKEPGRNRIPFLVDLREYKEAFDLKSLLEKQLKSAEVKPTNVDKFLKLLAEGHIMLILDAFDEMATMSSGKTMFSNFKQLNQAFTGDSKVILSSRTHYFRDKKEVDMILMNQEIDDIPEPAAILMSEILGTYRYESVYLKEFSHTQVQEYLQKAVKDEWETVYQKIESIYNLHDLSCRPVLLDMIVKTLPKIENGEERFNLTHLYEAYTGLWFKREEHRLEIIKEAMRELVEELAYRLWKEGKLSFHYSDLPNMISEHLERKIKTDRDLEEAEKEMRTASFLVRDDDGNYSFAHSSFQEFFIARKIKKEILKNNFDILDLKLLSKEIVFFFSHLMGGDKRIFEFVIKLLEAEYRNRITENALFIFHTVLKMSFLDQQFSLNEDAEFSHQNVEDFKKKVRSHLPQELYFQGAVLSGWTIPHMVYKNANFTEAKMEDSDFNGTTFEDVEFNRTYMKGSDFSSSTFKNVCFKQVAAHHCSFKNCRFEDCTITDSDFSMSNFMDAAFKSCKIEDNDFTGVGYYHSDFDIKIYKNNCYLGAGKAETEKSMLYPVFADQGHVDIIRTAAISSDGRFMVSGGDDKTVKLWDFETGRLINTMKGHDRAVLTVSISPDNHLIVSGSSDGEIKLWDLESGYLISTLKKHEDRVNSAFISLDNRRIVSGSSDHTVKLWDLESGHLIKTLEGHKRSVLSVLVCPDNQRFISVSSDFTVKFWNLENGHLIKTLENNNHVVSSVSVSQDNQWIVSSGYDKRIKLWNLESGGLLEKTLEGHEELVKTVFISSDNRWLVSGSDDTTVKLWDLKSGDLIRTFEEHNNIVNSVFIRQDNRLIVSASCDETIKVWDLKSGRLIQTLEGYKALGYFDITNHENLHRLYYRDRLALYPARDLPEMIS